MTKAIGHCYLVDIDGRKEICSLREIDKVKNEVVLECVSGTINAGKVVSMSRDALLQNLNLGVYKFPGVVVEDSKRIYIQEQEEVLER